MNENVILDRILNDANIQSKQIIDNANQEIDNLKLSLEDFDSELKQKYESETQKFKKHCLEYYNSNLEFGKRRLVLEAKNDILNDLKEKTIEKIANFSKEQKVNFIEKLIAQNAEENEILEYNIDSINDEDLSNLEIVKKLNLKISKNPLIKKGIVLSTLIYDKNLSFESVVNELFNKRKNEILKVLF